MHKNRNRAAGKRRSSGLLLLQQVLNLGNSLCRLRAGLQAEPNNSCVDLRSGVTSKEEARPSTQEHKSGDVVIWHHSPCLLLLKKRHFHFHLTSHLRQANLMYILQDTGHKYCRISNH